MLNKIFELLGMSDGYDDEDIVITSHKDEIALKDRIEQEMGQRVERLKQPMPVVPSLVICRGMACVELFEDICSALRQGKSILLDFRGVPVKEGQETINSLYEVVMSLKGSFLRITNVTFLATPNKKSCEEWVLDQEEEASSKEDTPPQKEEEDRG